MGTAPTRARSDAHGRHPCHKHPRKKPNARNCSTVAFENAFSNYSGHVIRAMIGAPPSRHL